MKSLKGTKTEKNLLEAFAGESMARNKYTWFGIVARKAGYDQKSLNYLRKPLIMKKLALICGSRN